MSQKHEYFGKYILLEKLATGGMAEVFLARAPGAGDIGKFVAIKRILPQFSDNADFRNMFQEEAKIAINLSHGNIVSIYEFGIDKGQLFLVMDYVEGRNLRQVLNKMKGTNSKFTMEYALYIIKDVAAGLDHAHRSLNASTGKPLNITHRDISPQNVMVSFEGEVKIVDFGIAKAETQVENTRTGTLKGKFGYMSPEQAEGQQTDLRTDIFSLGIVLWELLAHERLFTANNEINVLRKIRDCQVPSLRKINPNVDPELERITMKALARDRNLRYQTSAALHRDLNRFLNRHYPDFSPHDFSVFIKTQYADEILEGRRRLVEYSKVPMRQNSDDKTVVTGPEGNHQETLSAPNSDSQGGGTLTGSLTGTSDQATSPREFSVSGVTPSQKAKDNLEVKNTVPGRKILSDEALIASLDQINPKQTGKIEQTRTAMNLAQVNPNTGYDLEIEATGIHQAPRKKRKKANVGTSFINFMLFFAILVVTYALLVNQFPGQFEKLTEAVGKYCPPCRILNPNPPGPPVVTEDPIEDFGPTPLPPNKTDQASKTKIGTSKPGVVKPKVSTKPPKLTGPSVIVVNSDPSGADISINGVPTGKTTPTAVEVPEHAPFMIQLRKDKYLDYKRRNLTRKKLGRNSFKAVLQPAMIAYISIDVKPPRHARVFLNGKELSGEMLPIQSYAVAAGTELVVSAENKVTGESAATTLKLNRDQHKQVILRLGSRRPTGK